MFEVVLSVCEFALSGDRPVLLGRVCKRRDRCLAQSKAEEYGEVSGWKGTQVICRARSTVVARRRFISRTAVPSFCLPTPGGVIRHFGGEWCDVTRQLWGPLYCKETEKHNSILNSIRKRGNCVPSSDSPSTGFNETYFQLLHSPRSPVEIFFNYENAAVS